MNILKKIDLGAAIFVLYLVGVTVGMRATINSNTGFYPPRDCEWVKLTEAEYQYADSMTKIFRYRRDGECWYKQVCEKK